MRGQEVVDAHEAQDAVASHRVAGEEMEARMYLAVAFAGEGRILDVGTDEGQQGIVIGRSYDYPRGHRRAYHALHGTEQ